jgi:hypothetical protein
LALEENARNLRGVVDRQHNDGTGVMNEIAAHLDAAGFDRVVGAHPKNRAAIYGARGD